MKNLTKALSLFLLQVVSMYLIVTFLPNNSYFTVLYYILLSVLYGYYGYRAGKEENAVIARIIFLLVSILTILYFILVLGLVRELGM